MRNYYPDAPESLTISYRYTDPAIAQRVVADLVSIFEQTNVTMRRQAADEQKRQITEQEKLVSSAAPASGLAANSVYGVLLARRADVGADP